MPTGDVYKTELFYHTSQKQCIATFYYELGVTVPADPFTEAEALADAWTTQWLGTIRSVLSSGAILGCIKVSKVVGTEIPTFVAFYPSFAGLRAADPLPANIIAIIVRRGQHLTGPIRSLMFLTGVAEADTDGSFMEVSFFNGAFSTFANAFNDVILSSGTFNSANWIPVVPHTEYAYARKVAVNTDPAANTITLTDGTNWTARGFVSGPQFRINAPNRNKGSYLGIISGAPATMNLSQNNLENAGNQVVSCQQVITPVDYFTLQSAAASFALRQLNRRRSSHTGSVA